MSVNNYKIVREFVPGGLLGPPADGDLFLYTELMDRAKRVGNNGVRIVKVYFHRSLDDFDRHFPIMQKLCDTLQIRAYTRLSPRSFRAVAHMHARLVLDALLSENHAGVKTLYPSACGKVTPARKLWMFDVDVISAATEHFEFFLKQQGAYVATVPSKRGLHYIATPFDKRTFTPLPEGISLHLDNATNLYIPDGAA